MIGHDYGKCHILPIFAKIGSFYPYSYLLHADNSIVFVCEFGHIHMYQHRSFSVDGFKWTDTNVVVQHIYINTQTHARLYICTFSSLPPYSVRGSFSENSSLEILM